MGTDLFEYLQAFDDPDASMGAWQAMLEEGVRSWNDQMGTDLDPFDTWLEYAEQLSGASSRVAVESSGRE